MGEGVKKEYRVSLTYNGVHPNPHALIHHALEKQFLIYKGSVSVSETPETQGWTQDLPTEAGGYYFKRPRYKEEIREIAVIGGEVMVYMEEFGFEPIAQLIEDLGPGIWWKIPKPPPIPTEWK